MRQVENFVPYRKLKKARLVDSSELAINSEDNFPDSSNSSPSVTIDRPDETPNTSQDEPQDESPDESLNEAQIESLKEPQDESLNESLDESLNEAQLESLNEAQIESLNEPPIAPRNESTGELNDTDSNIIFGNRNADESIESNGSASMKHDKLKVQVHQPKKKERTPGCLPKPMRTYFCI